MPIAGEITSDFDVGLLKDSLEVVRGAGADPEASFAAFLLQKPDAFHVVRKFLGITDKRAYLELSYRSSRTPIDESRKGICGCYPWEMSRHTMSFFTNMLGTRKPKAVREGGARLLSRYLCEKGLRDLAHGLSESADRVLELINENLVSPREIQQRAAKRRGHGCEAEVARVVHACGVRFLPEDKHTHPMGAKDPHVDLAKLEVSERDKGKTHSFDLVVVDDDETVRVVMQSLIHTSDPGQYGVNKSDETVEIHREIQDANARLAGRHDVEHWALLDGVGFSENKVDTLNKMLTVLDAFFQLNTLFKVPLRLHRLGLCSVKAIRFAASYSDEDVGLIKAKYVPNAVIVLDADADDASVTGLTKIPAGCADIFV